MDIFYKIFINLENKRKENIYIYIYIYISREREREISHLYYRNLHCFFGYVVKKVQRRLGLIEYKKTTNHYSYYYMKKK